MATSLVRFFLQIFAILPIYAARVLLAFRKESRSSWHFGRIGIGSRQLLKWPAGEQNDVRESAMLSQPCLLRIPQRPNVVEGRSRLHISGTRGELLDRAQRHYGRVGRHESPNLKAGTIRHSLELSMSTC